MLGPGFLLMMVSDYVPTYPPYLSMLHPGIVTDSPVI